MHAVSMLGIARESPRGFAPLRAAAPLGLLVLLTASFAAWACVVPPADDELYYWCWAQSLQWSYYDHPALTAVMIRAGTELFGHSLFALRAAACISMAVVFLVILALTKLRAVAWWLLATPIFSLGACITTPDTPLLLFWSLYALWLVRLNQMLQSTQPVRWWHWCLGGVLLGCGVLGKYTMALAIPPAAFSLLVAVPLRRWIAGFVLHGVTAFITALPILIYNIQHDFAPLLYQWNHSMGPPQPSLAKFGDFVGMQVILFGTLPLVLFPWVLWNARTLTADPRLRVAMMLYALPLAFFLYKATRGPLEGNWALASYITFWPLAAVWYERNRDTRFGRWSLRLAFLPPVAAIAFAISHSIQPFGFVKPEADRIARQQAKSELAAEIATHWHAAPQPMFADTYQWVALLRFHGIDARQWAGVSRPSHFTQTPETPQDLPQAYILWENVIVDPWRRGLTEPVLAKEFPLLVRGKRLTTFYLWQVRQSEGD